MFSEDEKNKFQSMFNEMTSSYCLRNKVPLEESEEFIFGGKTKQKDQSFKNNGPVPIEENLHFKRYSKKRVHKYTPEEMAQIEKESQNTIVNDYGSNDFYHISDEERKKNDLLAEISLKLATIKSVYRRFDEYIEAMRIVYKAWEILSEKNYVHSKKEFFKLVAEGRIVSSRIMIPQLKNLKKYDMDLIVRYVSNPELDVSIFKPEEEEILSDETFEEEEERLMSDEDKALLEKIDKEEPFEEIPVHTLKSKFMNKYLHPKKGKKISYKQEVFNQIMDENRTEFNQGNQFLLSSAMFEENEKSIYDRVPFKGSWKNDEDVFLYNARLEEAHFDEKINRYRTYGDEYLENFFDELERNGIDTIELRKNMRIERKISNQKISTKELKQAEKQILQRIIKLNQDKKFVQMATKAEDKLLQYIEKGDDDD